MMIDEKSIKFGEDIRNLRKERGYSLRHLAYKTDVSYSFISKLERGERSIPKLDTLSKLAKGLNVPQNEIFKLAGIKIDNQNNKLPDNIIPIQNNEVVKIPVLGEIACGEPILANENIDGYMSVMKDSLPSGVNFGLRCKGDSMSPTINDGALVIIHQQPEVEDGEIAAVLIDGEATLKKVQHIDQDVLLMPINDKYKPIKLDGSSESRILGKAIQVITML